jgi:trk system potassium uptake protein TrkH
LRRRWAVNLWDQPIARRRESFWRRISAAQLFVGSFAVLIAVGAVGLRLLPGLSVGPRLSWIDCWFTMTSAVCVTGLAVVDTGSHFTIWGQAWILLFIQLGGLGILTFATLLTFALGGRLSLRAEEISSSGTEISPHVKMRQLTRDVVLFTVAIETFGALLLFLFWTGEHGPARAGWHAVFHSISAFCNAGFSTYVNNIAGLQRPGDAPAVVVIGALLVLGGLGFIVLEELALIASAWMRSARRRPRLSLHSRLVLASSALLIAAGCAFFLVLEWDGVFAAMPPWLKLVHAWFMSVTPRTAGFNTVDYGQAREATNFLTILLMTVGGSPGSTAGGMKTTTCAVIVLLAWSRLNQREVTGAFGRSIPEESVQRAVGIGVGCLVILLLGVFALTLTEDPARSGDDRFLRYMFECSSAFNTVGLSMGITASLSPLGKMLMIILMFVGRVGPASAAAALALRPKPHEREFRFAYEEVALG